MWFKNGVLDIKGAIDDNQLMQVKNFLHEIY